MGKRGPVPDSPAQQKAKGVWGADQRARNMPKPEPGRPKMPSTLSKSAKAAWKRAVPLLSAQKTIAKIDGERLARYCDLASKYWRCSRFLEENGDTYETTTASGDTMVRPYPQAALMVQYDAALSRTEAKYGMTPADRVSMGIAMGEIEKNARKAEKDEASNILEVGL